MRHLIFTLSFIFSTGAVASASADFNHQPLDEILRAHVRRGHVNYSEIRKKSKAKLGGYVAAVAATTLDGFSRDQLLAFYINAYNALVISEVVKRPGIKSVMKVKGFFDKLHHRVAGRTLTLNQLENKVIRPKFHEPRIHFALVCGAKSCPPLQSRAFSAKRLPSDLQRLAARFISGSGVRIEGGKVKISKLFEWYAPDFKRAARSVGNYLARFRKKDAALLKKASLQYQHYDWSLNGR